MKITRHTAKDMRQALRLVRDQLGPDAVILTSKSTAFGVEVTAAVDFDAARVEAQVQSPPEPRRTLRPEELEPPAPRQQPVRREQDPYTIADAHSQAEDDVQQSVFARIQAEMLDAAPARTGDRRAASSGASANGGATTARSRNSGVKAVQSPAPTRAVQNADSPAVASLNGRDNGRSDGSSSRRSTGSSSSGRDAEVRDSRGNRDGGSFAGEATRSPYRNEASSGDDMHGALDDAIDSYMAAGEPDQNGVHSSATAANANHANRRNGRNNVSSIRNGNGNGADTLDDDADSADEPSMGAELKAMRRILETQMAQLAWNDLTRRAPIHTEILRELTEMGLAQDFAAQIVAQLPAGTDMTKARRLSIALISQRINVTGDRWLDKGGRIALVGPTGVGKTTALAKLAVRWVLRHGSRSLALISADSTRIGAHDQMQALGQMIDVPVYTAESLDEIPKLLEKLVSQRFVLIDTPGMSQRDAQLTARMTQLATTGHDLEIALVLAASTQAGAIAETVTRFATANASSVLLTKVDEAASLGGILSVLARAELPISYVSEGQRVPEDLRPARSLELVSSAVHLAKSSGAAADEDLLRRRYGDVAHALA